MDVTGSYKMLLSSYQLASHCILEDLNLQPTDNVHIVTIYLQNEQSLLQKNREHVQI